LGRLKKSRDLTSDTPGHFSIRETGGVGVWVFGVSRDTATAQQVNVTPLFPDNNNHNDEDTEII
jgi:hypothetical protein